MVDPWCPEERRCSIITLAGGVEFDPVVTLGFDFFRVPMLSYENVNTGFRIEIEMHNPLNSILNLVYRITILQIYYTECARVPLNDS